MQTQLLKTNQFSSLQLAQATPQPKQNQVGVDLLERSLVISQKLLQTKHQHLVAKLQPHVTKLSWRPSQPNRGRGSQTYLVVSFQTRHQQAP